MKHILLPTDFSENSWNAIFGALKMYKDVDCCFYLLNTFQDESFSFAAPLESNEKITLLEQADKNSKEALANALSYLKKNTHNKRHSFQALSRLDDFVNATKTIIDEKSIDMVAMGTTGATGSKEIFIGSNAARIVKGIKKCPILLVPKGKDFKELKHVVFATDYTRLIDIIELEPLIELAELWQATISIVHIDESNKLTDLQKYHKELLKNYLQKVACIFRKIPVKGSIENTLSHFMNTNHADLIALIKYRHGFFEKLMREPIIKKIAFHIDVPFLVLPEL
ncbi:universal stress protein [Ascidiimonas sp. W6]|uniref:universal stress protein n=1 Tax=Ascidiimonas meishanensis TaxID=3128903 RepID=UPI0030EEB662